jgi:hypothetical protein
MACRVVGLAPRKLKTLVKRKFANKVMFFQETLEFANAINICYQRQNLQLQSKVPCGKTWAMAIIVIETLNLVVKQCVLINQTQGLWFLLNALQAALTISVKLKANVDHKVVVDPLL